MLVGSILDHCELLNLEKLPFEELLMKVKEQARMMKLDKDVSKGRAGVVVGRQQVRDQGDEYRLPIFGGQEEENTNISAFNGKTPGWGQQGNGKGKGKGKCKYQKGGKTKGKAREVKHNRGNT